MTENEFILEDRLGVIRDTIHKYGEDNFYLSFSGGKDSTVVHHLLDMAVPNNKIPRVFSNTGIEYNAIVEFVRERESGQAVRGYLPKAEHKGDVGKGRLSVQKQGTFSKSKRISSQASNQTLSAEIH